MYTNLCGKYKQNINISFEVKAVEKRLIWRRLGSDSPAPQLRGRVALREEKVGKGVL